jgi:hypothetical protein
MENFRLIPVVAAALVMMVGCTATDQQEVVLAESQPEHSPRAEEKVGWDDLTPESVGEPETRPRFIPAEDARRVPELQLQTFRGEKHKIRPGHPDRVTVVVFWSMDSVANRAAVIHLDGLVDRYYRMGVRGINVVEKPPTGSHRAAPRFLNGQGIGMKTYYDDFSGLRRMAKAARTSVKWEVPCIFLVDRRMRVRFFKKGFSFSGTAAMGPRGRRSRIMQNASRGRRIEDYLRRLLEER